MTINEQYVCKRLALGMSVEEFAAIAGVSVGIVTLFERGERIDKDNYLKLKNNIERYIRAFDKKRYLTTRIIEEVMNLQMEEDNEHIHTLSHLMIHVSKLNMLYVNDVEEGELYI